MKLRSHSILDVIVEIHVSDSGKFSAHGDSRTLASGCDTYKQALRGARIELKKKQIRVSVPYTTHDLLPAIARGRHHVSRDILIWADDGTENGKNGTLPNRWGAPVVQLQGDLTDKDLARIKKLYTTKAKVEENLDKISAMIRAWVEEHSFDLAVAVDTAIAEAAEEMAEAEDTTIEYEDTDSPDPSTPANEDADALLDLEDL